MNSIFLTFAVRFSFFLVSFPGFFKKKEITFSLENKLRVISPKKMKICLVNASILPFSAIFPHVTYEFVAHASPDGR